MTSSKLISNSQFTDRRYLSVCTSNAATIMTLKPLQLVSSLKGGPFRFAVVSQNRVFTVVETDTAPFLPNFVLVYELTTGTFLKSIEFNSDVVNLHANETSIFVSLDDSIQIVDGETLCIIASIERKSKTGSCCVTDKVLAYTNDEEPGKVIIASIPVFSVDRRVQCHKDRVRCVSVSPDSRCITTASEKGTLIRTYRLEDGKLMSEFRRGFRGATVIAVDTNNGVTCCCTNSTLHVFPSPSSHITVPLSQCPLAVAVIDGNVQLVTDDGILSIYKVDGLTNTAEIQTQHKLHSLAAIDQTKSMKRRTSL